MTYKSYFVRLAASNADSQIYRYKLPNYSIVSIDTYNQCAEITVEEFCFMKLKFPDLYHRA